MKGEGQRMISMKKTMIGFIIMILLTGGVAVPAWATPYLTVTQTAPDAYPNDSTGQLYQVSFKNTGDQTARNVTVDLDIPNTGFIFRPGTVTAAKNGVPLTPLTSGTDPVNITFSSQVDLAVNDTLVVTYRLGTDISILGGEHYVLHVTGYYNDGTTNFNDQDEQIILVKSGAIAVSLTPISPNPCEAYRGDQITLEARITNNGEGSLFAIPFHMDWGSGFGSPVPVPAQSNITPVLNGDKYEITLDEIPAGQSKYFRFRLTVASFLNFGLTLTATNPAEAGIEYTDSVVFNLLVNQPLIRITAPDITFEYGVTKSVDFTITNDNTSGNQGTAREFKLTTTIDPVMTVSNLAAGWTYASGVFTYTTGGGALAAGQTIHLTFDVVPKNIQNLVEGINGYILIMPSYKNDIDQSLNSPIVNPAWSVANVPVLAVTQSLESEATDGDNYRVFLAEHFTFKITAHLTKITKWQTNIELANVVPGDFTVTAATAGVGTINRTGNNITWTLTPTQASGDPILTVSAIATSDPARAGNFITNTATAVGTTIWSCVLTRIRSIDIYLQSRDAGSDYTYETKSIKNLPVEGSYDVCGKDGKNNIQYQLDYTFDTASTGAWTGSWVADGMDRSQTYVAGTAQYKIGAGSWTDIPEGSIVSTNPLKLDLGFLRALFGNDDSVAGKSVSFQYRLSLTNSSLEAGTTTVYTFLSRTDLMLAGATGGHVVGSEHHFYQGVFVPISRAAMNIDLSISNTVTKGQTVRPTITIGKPTPWDNNDFVVTLKTYGHYSYIGNPTYTGFGGMTPTVSITQSYPDTVTFTFGSPLETNLGGTIAFDVVKTDDAGFGLEAQLDFDDDLSIHSTHTDAATPDVQLEGNFSVTVNPNPVKVATHTLAWQVTVTNIGSGRAYAPVFTDVLKNFMAYRSSTVDGVSASPTVLNLGDGTTRVSWSLGDMNVNAAKVIVITVDTDGSSSDFTSGSVLSAYPTWRDRDLAYHSFHANITTAPAFTPLISSIFVKNSADNAIELCESGTLKLYVRNNGNTHNYNIILTQRLLQTGFGYIPGTARIGGIPINDPQVSGTNLIWTYESGQPNYLAQLQDMAPQSEFTIAIDVRTHEDFNIYQKVQPVATSWQKPWEFGGPHRTGTYTGAEYRVPILQPAIVLTVDGKNITAGDTGYTDNVTAVVGDAVEWRIRIANSGTAAARNVTLHNILPATMSFGSISPAPLSTLIAGQSWKISDIPIGTSTYRIQAIFNGPCGPMATDSASVTWGQESGLLSTPSDNDDTANLITQPQVSSTDINITSFTTKQGHVVVTLVTSGAPAFDLNLTLDLTSRFSLDSSITYSPGLTGPSSQPALNTAGNAPLVWHWNGPVPAGTHTITFDIRDANNSCSNNSSITPVINYTYENSSNNPFNGSFNSRTFTPAKTFLTVTKTPGVQIVRADGDTVTWTIQVTNTGTANATDLRVVDVLGDGTANNGFTYLATTSPAPSSITNNVLTWNNLDLNVGQTYTITLNARVNAAGLHTGAVTATEYNRDFTATVDDDTTSASVAMVNLSKTLDQSTAVGYDTSADSYAEIVKYTININYQDTCDYSNLIIRDTLPAGLQYVSESSSATKTAITPNHSGKNLVWNLTGFSGPETVTIIYYARIIDESQARGSSLNNAAKSSFDAHYSNGINASFPNTLPQLQDQESFLLKRPDVTQNDRSSTPASGGPVSSGQMINHTLTVLNQNSTDVSPAYEIVIQETIPAGERTADPSAGLLVKKNGSATLVLNTDYTCTYNSGTGQLTVAMLNTALGVLQKNETYVLTYSTTVDSAIGAGQTLNHSAQLVSYYSQPSGATGAKSYTGNTRTASYTTQNSTYTLAITSPVSGKVKPGDTVNYRVSVTVPKGTTIYDIGLADTLPAGLSYNTGSSNGLNKGGSNYQPLTPTITGNTITGQTLTWAVEGNNIDITNNEAVDWLLTIDFTATVLDAANIAQGNPLTDTYVFNYNKIDNTSGSRTTNGNVSVNLTVNEPQLTITKTVTSSGPYQAGSTVTYRITIQNSGAETAYDTTVTDTLHSKLTLSGVPATTPGGINFVQNGQQLTWGGDGALDIAPGSTVDIYINATLNNTVEPREVLGSGAATQWTSQDGSNANERTYNADAGATNITMADNTNMIKAISGAPTYVIGETFHYQLTVTLTKGTTDNVVVNDNLPAGVEFVSATLTPDGSGPVQYTLSHSPNAGEQGAINWNFGTVVIPGSQTNTITIDYMARILNTSGNQAGQTRTNDAYVSYQDALSAGRNTPNRSQTFTVKEPGLVISQSYTAGSWDAGDTVGCTVRVWHNSAAAPNNVDAYDATVTVEIPAGMSYVAGSSSPAATLAGNRLIWQISQINTTRTVGNPVTLIYNVQLADTVQPGQQIAGNTELTWTSLSGDLPGERTGADGVGGTLNDYAVTTSAALNAVDNLGLTGTRLGNANRPVGDNVTYELVVQLNEGTNTSVQVKNTIPSGMQMVSATIVKGHSGISYIMLDSPSPGATGEVIWNFGAITNPSNGNSGDDTITIDMVAAVLDAPGNISGHGLINTAHLEYIDGLGSPKSTINRNMSITVTEPNLGINITGPGTISLGQQVTLTLDIPNTGTGTAWQTNFTVTMPPEMRDQNPALQSLQAGPRTLSESGPDDYDVTYNSSTGQWVFVLKSAAARGIDGETLTLIFKAALNNDEVFTVHGITVATSVTQYYSLDSSGGAGIETRIYSPSNVNAQTTLTIVTPVIATHCTVDKPVAHPGETVHFIVTLTNNGNTNATNLNYTSDLETSFSAGTLTNVTTTSGSLSVNPTGGIHGTGQIGITGITIPQSGGTVTIAWDITLKPVLPDERVIDGWATLAVPNFPNPVAVDLSDVTIDSAPVFTFQNTDTDVNGGALAPSEMIRYTITLTNTGNENAKNSSLKNLIPSNTIYVPNSTRLNGVAVADDASGQSPLVSGMAIQTPGDVSGWLMVGKTTTIQLSVQVDPGVAGVAIIADQAELTTSSEGSGPMPIIFSDDPDTVPLGDATLSVVGTTPALYAHKTLTDNNGGQLLPMESLTYQTIITNYGVNKATTATYTDYIPVDTTFINGTITVNGVPSGITPAGNQFTCTLGTINPGSQVVVVYQVKVNSGTNGHIITCQGAVDCAELPPVASDADGNPANGSQPTVIPVGTVPVLRAFMTVSDINGGHVEVDEVLEYMIRVTNYGTGSAANVTLISPIPAWTHYVVNSTLVEGVLIADRSGSSPLLSPGVNIGTMAPGETRIIQYRVTVNHNTILGSVIDCQASFSADAGISGITDSNLDDGLETGNNASDANDDDPTRVQLTGNPTAANVTGIVWWDRDYNNICDSGETRQNNWTIEIYQGSTLVQNTTTNISGVYTFIGMTPGTGYQLRFKDPAGGHTWHTINGLNLLAGTILENQNYPLQPTGVIYDAITRGGVTGATVTISGPAGFDPAIHLGTGHASLVTGSEGLYYFPVLFGQGAPDGNYTITVSPPPTYSPVFPSTIIAPQSGAYIPANPGTVNPVAANAGPPQNGDSTTYYLALQLTSADDPVVNNHIALDPILQGSVALAKTAGKKNAAIGDFVPYTVQIQNTISAIITPLTLQDVIPAGFRYVKGSARVNGASVEPGGDTTLTWANLTLPAHGAITVTYYLMIGSRVSPGRIYKNAATAIHGITGTNLSNTVSASVRVTGDPVFDSSLIIGAVFHDKNANGIQDQGEPGFPRVKLVTVSGQIITTDNFGRYHLSGISVGDFSKGQNFIIKVDPRTIPAGMIFTTENPRVFRVTQGMIAKINFGLGFPKGATPVITTSTPAALAQATATPSPSPVPTATATVTATPSPTPTITASPTPSLVNPVKGYNKGSVLVNVKVTGIVPGTIIKLVNEDETRSITGQITRQDPISVMVFFNINNIPPGKYNLWKAPPKGSGVKLKTEFEVADFASIKNLRTLEPIYFDFDKSNIRRDQVPVTGKDLAVIKANSNAKIILGGYTDERGNMAYNLGLSDRRATSIKKYLIDNGIAGDRITIYAYGKEFAKQGKNENVWQSDRRVDVMLYEE
jgi:uncharacterized repeat protein (TIGR01451 family)/fimbrial isopeptide formation D2 family protein